MLVLRRRTGQGIVIQSNTVVRMLAVEGEQVKLGVTAPASVVVLREELVDAVRDENRRAASGGAQELEPLRRTLRRMRRADAPGDTP